MKELKLVRILDFYDEIQLFTAKDAVGCMYLCQLYESTADGSDYLCVAISQDRLDSFLKGILDLRIALTQPEISDQYYKVVMKKDVIQAFDLTKNDVQESMLPAEGYFFEPDEQTEDIDMIRESENCGSPLIRLALEDEKNRHEVSAECLSGVLTAYRKLLNCCYKKRNDKEVLKLDVVALKAASFDIHFKVDTSFDLLMDTPLINELSAIDDLFCFEDDKMAYRQKVKKFENGLAVFVPLLNVLKENNLSIRHKWVKSIKSRKVCSCYTPFSSIKKIADFFESEKNTVKEKEVLRKEETYIGKIEKLSSDEFINRKHGTVTLVYLDKSGKEYKEYRASVELFVDDYNDAIDAHMYGKYVKVVGVLSGTTHKKIECKEFSVLDD